MRHHGSNYSYMDAIRDWMDKDWSMIFAKIGMWLAIFVFGGIIIVVNGGFSVIGLRITAESFNEAGILFWAAISAIRFPVPVEVQGLPASQPFIPWMGVAAASFLQITILYRKSTGKYVPMWMVIFALFLTLYDLGTTYAGLGAINWIARAGFAVRGVITLLLTLGVETVIGLMLRERYKSMPAQVYRP